MISDLPTLDRYHYISGNLKRDVRQKFIDMDGDLEVLQ